MSKTSHGSYITVQKDWSEESNAKELAYRIKQYWKDKGKDISVWLESFHPRGNMSGNLFWNVRSNLINGLPK